MLGRGQRTEKFGNIRVTLILTVVGVLGTIKDLLKKEELEIRGRIETI